MSLALRFGTAESDSELRTAVDFIAAHPEGYEEKHLAWTQDKLQHIMPGPNRVCRRRYISTRVTQNLENSWGMSALPENLMPNYTPLALSTNNTDGSLLSLKQL